MKKSTCADEVIYARLFAASQKADKTAHQKPTKARQTKPRQKLRHLNAGNSVNKRGMDKHRKRKFGVWLSNKTDRRDDSWVYVWALSSDEAMKRVRDTNLFDETRYTVSNSYPVAHFRAAYRV